MPDVIFLAVLGLFLGGFIGAMAGIVPYPLVIILDMAVFAVVWIQPSDSPLVFLTVVGLTVAGMFATMASEVSFGFAVNMLIVLALVIWKRTGQGIVPSAIIIPLLIMTGVGLFYNFTYPDFCLSNSLDVCANPATWVNGNPTIWQGCITTCGLTAFSFFGSSIFSAFILAATNGDYVGFLNALFSSAAQTTITVLSIVTGVVLLLLSLGIGFTGQFLASGFGITINQAGTRFAQSYGIGLILFGVVFGTFGGWLFGGTFPVFTGPITSFGFLLGLSLLALLLSMYGYGLYRQANISGPSS